MVLKNFEKRAASRGIKLTAVNKFGRVETGKAFSEILLFSEL